METIKLQFQSNLKEKIISFLETLPTKEVEITWVDTNFEHNKKVLNERYTLLKEGKSKTYSLEEVDRLIERNVFGNDN